MSQTAVWAILRDRAISLVLDECLSPEGWFFASNAQNPSHGNFRCLFGRDSSWMCIFAILYARRTGQNDMLAPVKRTLEKLADTQGRQENAHSGEMPGKIIHELRTYNHEHLTRLADPPWYLYPDGTMRIYMSADSSFLFLLAVRLYWQVSGNDAWMEEMQYPIKSALRYALDFGDSNKDGLQDYAFAAEPYGGLKNQGWMDSDNLSGTTTCYPIALAEVQAYAYLAFMNWAEFFSSRDPEFSDRLKETAGILRREFNTKFPINTDQGQIISPGIDGKGNISAKTRSCMGHCLLSAATDKDGRHSIVDSHLVEKIRGRLMQEDMFDPAAGIRTLSRLDPTFDPRSYHNGAFWPFDNMAVSLGFRAWGFEEDASRVEQAILKAAENFDTPGVELFHYDPDTGEYGVYRHAQTGQVTNLTQGWSLMATALAAAFQCC